jgi:hypothetical protein
MILTRSPLLALGTLDKDDRPWTTLWGGEPGFSRAIGQSIIGVKATIDRKYDPLVEALLGKEADGEVVNPEGPGNMVGGLGIDLETRTRVKLYGRMAAGAVNATEGGAGEAQLVVKIEQSLGRFPASVFMDVSNMPQGIVQNISTRNASYPISQFQNLCRTLFHCHKVQSTCLGKPTCSLYPPQITSQIWIQIIEAALQDL